MEYDDLYDESPYVSTEIPRRRRGTHMVRAMLLICATIAASVLGISLYDYLQDQFIISSNPSYIAIFDKKSRTINICDRGNCTLITPRFPKTESFTIPGKEEGDSLLSRFFGPWRDEKKRTGQRLLGSFAPPHPMSGNPQMMGQMNPQMMQQMNPQMMQPQMANAAPQDATPAAAQVDTKATDEDDTSDADNAAPNDANEEAAPV